MEQNIYLVGLSYRTAGVDVRERYALTSHCSPDTWAIPLGKTSAENLLSPVARIDEACILSTCNRVEILAVGEGSVPESLQAGWAAACGQSVADLASHVYVYQGSDAIRHLFEVASSLDSMVLGEPQILGQLKDAYRKATLAHATGSIINRLMHKAFSVAKRVRTETEVASSAVSISYAAVELAKRIFGDMNGYRAMLVGAGEMAELAATHLLQAGIESLAVANRTFAHAQELATRFHGEVIPFDQLFSQLDKVDIVISSTGAPETIIRAKEVREALVKRKNRPMFFIDIAVPRDIDPGVNNLDNVYLYDIDDLKEVVEENLSHRREEANKAKLLIEEEVQEILRWLHSLELQPVIVDLLGHLDVMAGEELARTLKRLGPVDDATKEALQVMLHSFVRKISHNPLLYLKQAHETGDVRSLRLVRELFDLDSPQNMRHNRRHGQKTGRCPHRVEQASIKEDSNVQQD